MSGFEKTARPGAPLLWRWPGGWRERWRAGRNLANPTWREYWIQVIGMLVFVALFAGFPVFDDRESMGLFGNVVLMLAGGFAWVFGVLIFHVGYYRVSELTLTAGAVRHAIGFPWPRYETIPRADIRSAVIYEGDGTVVLLGGDRELIRARHVAEAAAFAEALGAPTVAWPSRKGENFTWRSFCLMLISMLAAMAMMLVAMFLGVLAGFGLAFLLNLVVDLPGSSHPPVAVLLGTPFILAAALLSAFPVFFLTALAGKILFGPEWLRRHLSFLLDQDLRSGRTTALRKRSRLARLRARSFITCARWLGIAPLLEPQPDLRGGATPEMAAAALTVAEGTA